MVRMEGMVPKELGALLRQRLMDPQVGSLSLHNRPAVQAILDSITEIRAAAMRDEFAARQNAQPLRVKATLAMMEQWSDTSVSAVAVYRVGKIPENLILLPRTASLGNIAAGIRALSALRKHDTATQVHDSRLAARGGAIPAAWRIDKTDRVISAYLAGLSSETMTTIPGIGRARSVVLPVELR